MKKKLICIALLSTCMLTTGSCTSTTNSASNKEYQGMDILYYSGSIAIYVDNISDVMYITNEYRGGITVMIDRDGNPLTYKKYKEYQNEK